MIESNDEMRLREAVAALAEARAKCEQLREVNAALAQEARQLREEKAVLEKEFVRVRNERDEERAAKERGEQKIRDVRISASDLRTEMQLALGLGHFSTQDPIEEAKRLVGELDAARAKCDELREANVAHVENDIRWRIASGSDTPKELRERLDEAREIVGCVERDSFLASLRALACVPATLDEALRVQGAIWDAVGGQRDGESLVDAVRRMARSDAESMRILTEVCSIVCPRAPDEHIINATRRLVEERNELLEQVNDRSCKVCECLCVVPFDTRKCPVCGVVFAPRAEVSASAQYASYVTEADRAAGSLPKPARVEVRQWWACFYENGTRCPFRIASTNEIAAFGRSQGGVHHSGMIGAMLTDPRWRYLGNGERPIDPGEPAPTADANVRVCAAELASLRRLRDMADRCWTALGEQRERLYDGELDRAVRDMVAPIAANSIADAIAGLSLDDIAALSAAGWVMRWNAPSMRWVTPGGAALDPATWRETLRREAARLTGKRFVVGAVMEEAKMGEVVGSAVAEAERARLERSIDVLTVPCVVQVSTGEIQRLMDEAREAGRAEMRDRACDVVVDAVRRKSITMVEAEGIVAAILAAAAVAKTPAVSASEVTGRAIPGAEATETAGARESVAREDGVANDLASRWKAAAASNRTIAQNSETLSERGYHDGRADAFASCADELRAWRSDDAAEIARLKQGWRDSASLLGERIEELRAWRAATGCESPEKARAAMLSIEKQWSDATACQTPAQARELIATLRAMPLRTDVDESEPSVGDRVIFVYDGGGEEPGVIRRVYGADKFDLWTTSLSQPFVFGVPRARFRLCY